MRTINTMIKQSIQLIHCIIMLTILISLFGCKSVAQPLETVDQVDLNKYAGKWYEIASYPNRFQKGCHCTTAEYTTTGKKFIRVENQCRRDSPQGKLSKIRGKAFTVPGSGNAKLKVQFFWPFRGDYWIIDLAKDYHYAVVSNQSRKYLWILCREPVMDDSTFSTILQRITQKGFDPEQLRKTDQSCW